MTETQSTHPDRVGVEDLKTFAGDVLLAHGVNSAQINSVADVMAWSDLVGRSTHGIARLKIHVDRLAKGVLNPTSQPVVSKAGSSMELIDGDRGFGHHVACLAIDRAIDLARESGVGSVGVHNSNFFGAAAYYVNRAAEAGMIGLALSNSVPNVAAFGGAKPVFGTNPLGFGAPRGNGRHFLLDMATSAWSASAVRASLDRGDTLPEGVAVDEAGVQITEPRHVAASTLLPLGGAKGYGLALMIEMLTAVITGAGVSRGVASLFRDMSRSGDNGHFMLAIDISKLMPLGTYYERIEDLIETIKSSNPNNEVLYPGEHRWRTRDDNLANGIPIAPGVAASLDQLARPLGLVVPWR